MRILLVLAALIALTAPATAMHCSGWSTSAADVAAGGYYVADDCFLSWCTLFGLTGVHVTGTLWVYEESNGIPGLQRGDEIVDDTCHDQILADTIIF